MINGRVVFNRFLCAPVFFKNVFCVGFPSCIASPFCRSSNPGPAWQDQSLPQILLPVWCSTCRREMFFGCKARRCWTWATHRPHTAKAPGTDLYPAYAWWWISQWDSSQCQSNPVQQERHISGKKKLCSIVFFGGSLLEHPFFFVEQKRCVCVYVQTHRNTQ